jgi:hypothetical protein
MLENVNKEEEEELGSKGVSCEEEEERKSGTSYS